MSEKIDTFFDFSIAEMRDNGDKIRTWAAQNDNLLLKALAQDVINTAQGVEK